MKPRRLFWRVYLHGLGLLLAVSLALGAMAALNRDRSNWHRLPGKLATWVRAELHTADPERLRERLEPLQEILEADLAVYARGGALLAAAGEPPAPLDDTEAAALTEPDHLQRGLGAVLAVPLTPDAYLLVAWRRRPGIGRFVLGIAAVLLVLALASVPLAKAITRPLERIAATARRLGAGDLSARTSLVRRDEVGELARALDEMAARLESQVARERALLADISHELRTPLARIRVALALVEEEGGRFTEVEEDLAELDRIVADVLDSARLSRGEADFVLRREQVSVAALAEAAARRFAERHPAVRLEPAIATDLPPIEADPALLRRVLDNLLDNAARHGAAPVALRVTADAAGLTVEVRDHGPGIAADDLPHVFEPFYRADRSRARHTGGVGLGLTLCRRIVEAHGGRIDASNPPGGGAAFRFSLPATRRA